MGDTWVTDMRHYLTDTGEVAAGMPAPAMNLAVFLGSIVGWVSRTSGTTDRTNVWCRRSPGRNRCVGEIRARFAEEEQAIEWHCPECGDNGIIRGWQTTRWDRSRL